MNRSAPHVEPFAGLPAVPVFAIPEAITALLGGAGMFSDSLHSKKSGVNALSPDLMSSAERLEEIGRILAVGIARARQAKAKSSNINNIGEVSLDFGAPQRGHVLTKRRPGEKT